MLALTWSLQEAELSAKQVLYTASTVHGAGSSMKAIPELCCLNLSVRRNAQGDPLKRELEQDWPQHEGNEGIRLNPPTYVLKMQAAMTHKLTESCVLLWVLQ